MKETTSAISVILGRVSTEDSDRVLETIEALSPEFSGEDCEIIIADRLGDETTYHIQDRYPQVKLITCSANTSLPEMRALAFEASTAQIVAVTEDHCVPCQNWAKIILHTFSKESEDLVAVGGAVVNGVTDSGLDWATYLCEYSFFAPPVSQGKTEILPGMNVAYKRSALEKVPRRLLRCGFWETTVHASLLEAGGTFISLNDLIISHKKRFSWKLFATQRFIYSRYYAGLRFGNATPAKRLAAAVASLALPPLLLVRASRAARMKNLRSEFRRALPHLVIFYLVWAIGESVGAALGPKNSLTLIE